MESRADDLRSARPRFSGCRCDRSWRPLCCLEGPVGEGIGLRHRRSPHWTPGYLHVEEERCGAAALRHLALALFGDLPGLLAVLAAHREGQRAQPLLSDLFAAVEAVAVVALLEPRERVVDLVERLRLHLDEREFDVLLNVGLGALDRVEHFVELAAPSALSPHVPHFALVLGLNLPPTLLEHLLEVAIAGSR